MKKNLLFLLVILLSKEVYSKTLSEYLNYKSSMHLFMNISAEQVFFLEDDKIVEFEILDDIKHRNLIKYRYTYDIREENDLVYLYVSNQNEEKKFLMLVNEFYIFLYTPSSLTPFFMGELQEDTIPTESLRVDSITKISASSYLEESTKSYYPNNILNCNLGTPWVEGVSGNGIGEKITLTCPKSRGMLISIGYVSLEKPYLYKKNSRPKKLKITLVKNGKSCFVDLQDTPNPQVFVYPDEVQYSGDIELEIIEVYSGTTWDDTCINFIKPLFFMPCH